MKEDWKDDSVLPEDPSLGPSTHIVVAKNVGGGLQPPPQNLLAFECTHTYSHAHNYIQTYTQTYRKIS